MTNANKEFWDRVKKTDPKRVKAITGKPYKGNSPQPYYLVERMTEEFGMCGIGWGINILNERMERLTDTDVLHVAVVELWYKLDGTTGSITQVGQTKAAYKTREGSMMVDEDAPKKSVTDALTKCMSYLGFAGDIFSGQWDDSKYVAELNKEFVKDDKAVDTSKAEKDIEDAVKKGTATLRAAWEKLDETTRMALKGKLAGWKEAAKKQDEALATQA